MKNVAWRVVPRVIFQESSVKIILRSQILKALLLHIQHKWLASKISFSDGSYA